MKTFIYRLLLALALFGAGCFLGIRFSTPANNDDVVVRLGSVSGGKLFISRIVKVCKLEMRRNGLGDDSDGIYIECQNAPDPIFVVLFYRGLSKQSFEVKLGEDFKVISCRAFYNTY